MKPLKSVIAFIISAGCLTVSCATPPLALDVYKLRLKEVFKKYATIASLKSSSSASAFSFGTPATPVSAALSFPSSASEASAEKARKDSDYKSLKESSKGNLEAINAVQSDLNSITPSVGLEQKHDAIKKMFEGIKASQEEINALPALRSELKNVLDNARINALKTKQAASLKALLEGTKALDDIGILGESGFSGGTDQSKLALLLADPVKLNKELEVSAKAVVDSLVELGRDPILPSVPSTLASSAPASSSPTTPSSTNSLGMKFVSIQPGTFMMGSPESEKGRYSNETPHQVTLTKPFALQTTEVTQGQWKSVMGNNPSSWGWLDDLNLPVEQVSWHQVQEFITKLNGLCHGTYRLPTEAEWEYAARAGSKTAFFFGDEADQLGSHAWYLGNSSMDDAGKQSLGGVKDKRPHSVGLKKPNAWGLYDMAGNVTEWVQDVGGDYRGDAVTDPTGAATGNLRVIRGGGFKSEAQNCRSGHRGYTDPGDSRDDRGFRLVRSTP